MNNPLTEKFTTYLFKPQIKWLKQQALNQDITAAEYLRTLIDENMREEKGMITYRNANTYYQAARMASEDTENWNEQERELLAQIAEGSPYQNPDTPVWQEQVGSGRTFGTKNSKIQFHIHEAARGFNVGRAK